MSRVPMSFSRRRQPLADPRLTSGGIGLRTRSFVCRPRRSGSQARAGARNARASELRRCETDGGRFHSDVRAGSRVEAYDQRAAGRRTEEPPAYLRRHSGITNDFGCPIAISTHGRSPAGIQDHEPQTTLREVIADGKTVPATDDDDVERRRSDLCRHVVTSAGSRRDTLKLNIIPL